MNDHSSAPPEPFGRPPAPSGDPVAHGPAGVDAGDATPPGAEPAPPEEPGQPLEPEDRSRKRSRGFLTELPVLVLIAFVLALLLKTFLVQAFFIPSSSMEPTLAIGDRVLVNKLSYTFREPERGEVVVFTDRVGGVDTEPANPLRRAVDSLVSGLGLAHPGDRDFIKRIIGLPGETLELREGVVYIDGEAIPEATTSDGGYLSAPDYYDFGPVDVPQGHYFMMGDNRPNSADSRSPTLGTISREDIVGRAFVIIWPLNRADTLPIAGYEAAADGASLGALEVATTG